MKTTEEIMHMLDIQMLAHLEAALGSIDGDLPREIVLEDIGACKALADTAFFLDCINAEEHISLYRALCRVLSKR